VLAALCRGDAAPQSLGRADLCFDTPEAQVRSGLEPPLALQDVAVHTRVILALAVDDEPFVIGAFEVGMVLRDALLAQDDVREQLSVGEDECPSSEIMPSEEHVRHALEASGGNRAEAAKMLGLKSRYALYRLMKKQGIADATHECD
jgi:DNA-binding NtrC family response regulator